MKLRKILCGVTAAAIALGSLTAFAQPTEGNSDIVGQADQVPETGEYIQDGIKYYIRSDSVYVEGPVDKNITEANIPDNIGEKPVTIIGNRAFEDCSSLVKLTLPKELKTIDAGAFMNCPHLTVVMLPDKVESLEARAFSGCTGLSNMGLNTGLKTIGMYCFEECDSLLGLGIPYTVEHIGDGAFRGCDKLVGISISTAPSNWSGKKLYTTKDNVLYYRPELYPDELRVHTYPRSNAMMTFKVSSDVTYIDSEVRYARYLTAFDVAPGNERYRDIDGVLFSDSTLEAYPSAKNGSEYTIPDGISGIMSGAFSGTAKLEKLIIPKSVYNVSNWAFVDNEGVSSVKEIVYEGTMEEWNVISYEPRLNDAPFIYNDIVVTCSNGTVDKNGIHPTDSDYERTEFITDLGALNGRIRCDVKKGAFESEPSFTAERIISAEGGATRSGNYKIEFADSNGNKVDPKGGCTVRIHNGYLEIDSSKKMYVYRIGSDGKYTEITGSRIGENSYAIPGKYVEFFTSEMGEFFLTTEKQDTEEPPASSSSSSTKPVEPPVSSSSTSSTTPEEPPVSSSSSTAPTNPPVSSTTASSTPMEPIGSASFNTPSDPADIISNGVVEYTPVIIGSSFDESTANIVKGIKVITTSGAIESGAVLSVKPAPYYTGSGYAFDITFIKDGVEVQPRAAVNVQIPVPEDLKGKNIYVYHVDDGKFVLVESKVEDDYVKFNVSHFSTYVLTNEKLAGADSNSNKNPATGIALTFVPATLIAGTTIIAAKKKK